MKWGFKSNSLTRKLQKIINTLIRSWDLLDWPFKFIKHTGFAHTKAPAFSIHENSSQADNII